MFGAGPRLDRREPPTPTSPGKLTLREWPNLKLGRDGLKLSQQATDLHVPRRHKRPHRRAVILPAAPAVPSREHTAPHELADALAAEVEQPLDLARGDPLAVRAEAEVLFLLGLEQLVERQAV